MDLGPISFNPLEGERAENRCCEEDSVPEAGVDWELTELVEAFRRPPMKETESRALFLGIALLVAALPDDCLGGRETDDDGDPRTDCFNAVELCFGVAPSSLGRTPNSLVEMGEGLVEELAVAVFMLVRRLGNIEDECFKGGLAAAEVRLEIRGIFVGVSLGRPETEFMRPD